MPEQVDELVAAYLSGMTARFVASQFGIHRTTVAAHLERLGIPRRGWGMHLLTHDQAEEAGELRAQGLSYRRIGEQLGVSSMTVWRAVNA